MESEGVRIYLLFFIITLTSQVDAIEIENLGWERLVDWSASPEDKVAVIIEAGANADASGYLRNNVMLDGKITDLALKSLSDVYIVDYNYDGHQDLLLNGRLVGRGNREFALYRKNSTTLKYSKVYVGTGTLVGLDYNESKSVLHLTLIRYRCCEEANDYLEELKIDESTGNISKNTMEINHK